MKLLSLLVVLFSLIAGCATPNARIAASAERDKAFYALQQERERTRQQQLAVIEKASAGAGDVARALAVIEASRMPATQPVQAAPVVSEHDPLLEWFRTALQAFSIYQNGRVARNASDNALEAQLGAYEALRDVAGNNSKSPTTYTYTYTASGPGSSTGGDGYYHTENIGPNSQNPSTSTIDSHDATAAPLVVVQPAPLVVEPLIWTPAP